MTRILSSLMLFCVVLAFAQTGEVYFDAIVKDTDCMHLNVTVCVLDSFGWHVPELVLSDFHFTEDSDPVLPPSIEQLNYCAGYCSDIVLLFDLSGSMDDNVDSFETALEDFAAPLTGLDYRVAMAVFNGCPEDFDGVRWLVHTDFSAPIDTTGPDVWATTEDEFDHLFAAVQMYFDLPWSMRGSGWEDQYGALHWIIDTLDWRPGCSKNAVMFTDEEVQVETAPCDPYYDEYDSSLFKIMDYCFAESVTFFAVCPPDSDFEWYPASGDSPDRQYYTGYRDLADTTGGIWSDLFATDYSSMVSELAEAIVGPPCCYEFRYMTDLYCVDSIDVAVDVVLGTDYFGSDDTSYLSFCQPEIISVIPSPCGGITTCENQTMAGYFQNSIYGDLDLTSYIFTVNGDTISRSEMIRTADSLIYTPSDPFDHMDTVVFSFPYYRNEWNCIGYTPPCTFYVDSRPPGLIEYYPEDGDTILINEFEIYGSIRDDYSGIDTTSVGHIAVLLDGDTAVVSEPIWMDGDTTGFRIDSLIDFWDGNITVCVGGLFDSPDYDYCPPNVMPDTCWSFFLATLERLVSFPIMSGASCETVLVPLEIDDMEFTVIENATMRFRTDPHVLDPLDIVLAGSITAGWFIDSLTIDHITGEVYAEIGGASIGGLTEGGILLFMEAVVPCNAAGGDYCDIEIQNFEFNEGYPMVRWEYGFFIVTLQPMVFFCDVHLNRTSTPSPEDRIVTFGATYGGTEDYDVGLDYMYVPPPDWFVDGWFEIEDSVYTHIFGLDRDVKSPTPTVIWNLVTSDEEHGIAKWNPAVLPEGEFRINGLVDMKRDTMIYFGEDDTLHIEWTLPFLEPDTIELEVGWNLVSLPVLPAGVPADDVFHSDYGVFRYNPLSYMYEFAGEVCDGEGYWVYMDEETSFMSAGSPLSGYRRQIYRGWNLIGAIGTELATSEIAMEPPGGIIPPIFGWDGSGYISADYILPGNGYWILSSFDGVLHAPSGYRRRIDTQPEIQWEVVIDVLDEDPDQLIAAYSRNIRDGLSAGDIAIPPPRPEGERKPVYLVEDGIMLTRLLSSGEWRLVAEENSLLSFAIPNDVELHLDDRVIVDGEVISISPGQYLLKAVSADLPEKFEVLGCVPNPFNSRTDIIVALPGMGEVNVELFDITGHKITTMSRDLPAGISRIEWNGLGDGGHEVASGLYLIRVKYDDLSIKTKVMLIK